MRAIKLQGQVKSDHSLNLQLPNDIQEGPAEVIVLVEQSGNRLRRSSSSRLAEILTRQPDPRYTRSKEEIDRYLQEERDSWE